MNIKLLPLVQTEVLIKGKGVFFFCSFEKKYIYLY